MVSASLSGEETLSPNQAVLILNSLNLISKVPEYSAPEEQDP